MSGVKYCHEHKICHRDLKPENLLLDEQGDLKISDFGLSALYNGNGDDTGRGTLLHTTCGTPNYVAPEVLADKGYDGRAADVWSCGVILYVLLAGFLPFDEPTMSALFRKIQSVRCVALRCVALRLFTWCLLFSSLFSSLLFSSSCVTSPTSNFFKQAEYTYPSWFSEDVKDLLDHILVDDPKKRFTIAQICTHKWMKPDEWVQGDAAPAKTKKEEADDKGAFTDTTVEGGEAADDDEGPRKINAFDLINMLGGSALNRWVSSTPTQLLINLSIFLSVCPSVCLSVCLSVNLSAEAQFYLSVDLVLVLTHVHPSNPVACSCRTRRRWTRTALCTLRRIRNQRRSAT